MRESGEYTSREMYFDCAQSQEMQREVDKNCSLFSSSLTCYFPKKLQSTPKRSDYPKALQLLPDKSYRDLDLAIAFGWKPENNL